MKGRATMSRLNKTSNPVFRSLEKDTSYAGDRTASYLGIGIKIGLMFLLAIVGGLYAYNLLIVNQDMDKLIGLIGIASIAGFVSVLIGTLSVRLAAPFALLYAAAQGLVIGTLTIIIEAQIPGAAVTAAVATAVIFGVMLLMYSIRAIRVTPKFRKMMFAIIIGILIFSILSIFVKPIADMFYGNTMVALLLSGFFIVYGAFMLTLDFDRAEMLVSSGADKKYEWTIAIGLMVTIIWIYVEILRFIVILASMNRD